LGWNDESPNNEPLSAKDQFHTKKKTYGYKERDDVKRAAFIAILASKAYESLFFVDESGIDDTEDYPYGYSPRGQRFHALRRGSRTTRVSMIAALNKKELQAPMTFEGYCNTKVVEAWVENELVPILKPGQTVILDNARFHKSKKIEKMIMDAGGTLLYLPPYSPDLNDIEHPWFPVKNKIRKNIPNFQSLHEAVDYALQ
jgi:transposase